MKKGLKNIVVIYNLPEGNTPDDLDTQSSARGVVEGLRQAGYVSDVLGVSENNLNEVGKIKADLVFNLLEWSGHNSHLAGKAISYLEKAGLPYTGSNAWGYETSCNKVEMKRLLTERHITTPKYVVAKDESIFPNISSLKFPVIVKPGLEHSAIGISQTSVCEEATSAQKKALELLNQFHQPILIEEYIDGDEAQVTVLEKNGQPWVLPPAIFKYKKQPGYWPINTYEAKWGDHNWESAMSEWSTDNYDKAILSQMESLARDCYIYLGGRSYPRVDMRLHGDKVYVLEVNNNPGIDFDSESGITVSAKKVGLDWPKLLTNIVEEAYSYHAAKGSPYDTAVL